MMRRQSGVTLIENLIAILIVSIGLFAMAGLLTLSMKMAGKAQYETQAVYAAQMISSSAFALASSNPATLAALNSKGTNNTTTNSALNQALTEWTNYTVANLPGGTGQLTVVGMAGGTCTTLPCVLDVNMTWTGSDNILQIYNASMVMGF